MIDMYDLPTEAELAQAIMESAKENDTTGEIDEKRIFPFWSPTGGKNVVKLSDKTGVVTPKVDFTQTETRMDKVWEDFLASERAKDKKNAKPVTEVDAFGSVVLSSFAQEPDTDKLVGSIKALKKTSVKDMKGKVTHTTEELGVAKVITKSNAAKPNKNNLVGIVKPKTDKECFKSLPGAPSIKNGDKPMQSAPVETKVYKNYSDTIKPSGKQFADYTEKKSFPGTKAGKTVASDKTGVVKPQGVEKAGKKVFKNIDGFKV